MKQLKEEGIMAFGPYPADSFFTPKNIHNFDGILSMYHDQGLTAFKTLYFMVNWRPIQCCFVKQLTFIVANLMFVEH